VIKSNLLPQANSSLSVRLHLHSACFFS